MKKEEVIISQGNRPFWHNIMAAFFYTVAVFCVIFFFFNFEFSLNSEYAVRQLDYIDIGAFALSGAFYFSLIQTYYFDFKKKMYKHESAYLIFRLGKWKEMPLLEYISVFKKEEGLYEVNLWHLGNKHFKIYEMFDEDEAMNVGKKLATTLQIDLLDATVANDSKWIDL
ncbi:hypothetical protein IMCC3317_32830 [Kordia antarctica]|uniref:Uncharacterized protein n=1 Tax=Kordia antarctica TaxID=1218801 RepID=A0A7L4ZN35_9FLAO|nr:hypothetical protein [Kordia antarctica]QHI37900.1 hypothetical protein IMCC3317_32830 [Kordia antarctica]